MEVDEIREDIPEEKPKTKKRKKSKPEPTSEEDVKTEPVTKKAKKSTKKKKPSATKKKKVVEEDINNANSAQADDTTRETVVVPQSGESISALIDNSEGSELQPTGQAEVSKIKVEVTAKNPDVLTGSSPATLNSLETTETNIQENKVAIPEQFFSGNSRVETVQNQVLPFTAIKVRNVVGKVINLTAEIIPNKVIVQGIVHEQLFFVGNDNIVHHLADDVHFSTFLDVPGAQPGMNAQVSAIIEEIIPELAPDGLSVIKKIIIEVFVKVTETVQLHLEMGDGPKLFLKQVIGENTGQTLIETDLTLFTEAVKIDEIVGTIKDITVEAIKDKVIIQGVLHKQLFFIDTSNRGRHQAEEIPFSHFIDIPGVVPGVDVQVHPRIEGIFFKLISPTIVRQKTVLEFFAKVTQNVLQTVQTGNGPLLKVEEFIGENNVQELSETVITLNTPAIKVREIIAQLRNLVTNIIPNKVIVQGTIHKQIFFIGTDNVERHQAEDVPFSLFLDIPGVTPGNNVQLTPKIEAVFFELVSDTELRQKVIFEVTVIVTQEVQLNLVTGMGALFKLEQVVGENTRQVLVVRREEIVAVKPVVTKVTVVTPGGAVIGQQQILLQNKFPLPVPAIKVKEVNATVSDISVRIVPDGVLVEGIVNKTIVFVGTDNIVRSINEQVPFSILVRIPGITPDQITNTTVTIEDIIFNLDPSGTTVNQTIVLKAVVEGVEPPGPTFTVVTDVSGPGITQTKVRVQGLVLTPAGAVFQEFDVVTDVSGPGIINVTKQTVLLQRVGEPAPTPITVVTDVEVDP